MIQFYSGQLDSETRGQSHEETLSLLYKGQEQENVELRIKLDYEFKI